MDSSDALGQFLTSKYTVIASAATESDLRWIPNPKTGEVKKAKTGETKPDWMLSFVQFKDLYDEYKLHMQTGTGRPAKEGDVRLRLFKMGARFMVKSPMVYGLMEGQVEADDQTDKEDLSPLHPAQIKVNGAMTNLDKVELPKGPGSFYHKIFSHPLGRGLNEWQTGSEPAPEEPEPPTESQPEPPPAPAPAPPPPPAPAPAPPPPPSQIPKKEAEKEGGCCGSPRKKDEPQPEPEKQEKPKLPPVHSAGGGGASQDGEQDSQQDGEEDSDDDSPEETDFVWDTVEYRRLANKIVISPRTYKAVGIWNEEHHKIDFLNEEDEKRHEAEKAKQ
jgi:hypothetical protein